MTMLQACLNGNRPRSDHPAVPITPQELAEDARRALAAGARELHVHPRGPDGGDTVEPGPVADTVRAIRAACPGTPLGLTTGLWTTGGDAERRLALVAAWDELPDYRRQTWPSRASRSYASCSPPAESASRPESGRARAPSA